MATNEREFVCDVCQIRDLYKSAKEYCSQCEEALCRECKDHHKISKLSKLHQTISIEQYQKLPSFIKQIKHNCEEHNYFLEFYCKSHESLCCKLCLITGHKECKETTFIDDFLTPPSEHQSAALDNIERALKDLESNIFFALTDRIRNLTELHEQKRIIGEHIKEKRREINTRLDHLEGVLLEKVSAMEKEYCSKIEEVIAKLEEAKTKVDEIQKDIDSVKLFASNLQIFMGTKAFQENLSTNEMNVQTSYDNGSFNNLTMECSFNDKLDGLIKEIQTFGEIEIDNREKHVAFTWKGDKSAQMLKSFSREKSIENMNVRLIRKIYIDGNGLTGCAMSEAGNMLFLQSYKNSLMMYAPNGEFHSESHINTAPSNIGYDLTLVDSNTVAVSSGGNPPYKIYLIDMNNAETRKVFHLFDYCYGLSYHDGSFTCCTYKEGIIIYYYDVLNQNLTEVRKQPYAPKCVFDTYIASNANYIYHSNSCDHSVVCYDYSGRVQWKYVDSLLRKPYGITLDNNANIYVAGSGSNNIVVISKDGKQAKELIGASEGISNPRAIYFDKTKNKLLVTNYKGVAFLYDVT